jgi:hypothetical protein
MQTNLLQFRLHVVWITSFNNNSVFATLLCIAQDIVIIRCDDLQAGLVQWSIAVGPGQIAGLHFNAYGGDFERIPAQCFPGGSLPQACSGSGH